MPPLPLATLPLALARSLVDAALARAAAEFKRPVCVAIVDENGFLTAYVREDGAPVRSIAISQGKAYTAVRMQMNTDAFFQRLARDNMPAAYFCDDKLTALAGGAVLKTADGAVVGGVGVSGLSSAEDQIVANFVAERVASAS